MASKSDFAQKLLNDLRLRKERMGVSQGSARNHSTARDAYRDPGNMQRGSRHTKSISGPNIKESSSSSHQIVSYAGRQQHHHHQRSETAGDLSLAFTYAVNNGGKLMNVDFSTTNNTNTMIDFLNQIGRRTLHAGNNNNNNGTVTTSLVKHRQPNDVVSPALTSIQIKEISKGVQNLYEIVKTTSNGVNVNRYSMEVGKELLKGAKGLEESLRMLVNLQEASELMVNPKRKSRVTLLEVDDRNDVALPRFSFDKPNKKSNSPVAGGNNDFRANKWTAAGDGESVGSVRSDKGRISNVIAKLMGLEEVPVKVELNSRRECVIPGTMELNSGRECVILETVELNSRRGEVKKVDLNKNIIKKSSKPIKDSEISLTDRKPQQIRDSVTNVESKPIKDSELSLTNRKPQQIRDSVTNAESKMSQSIKNNGSGRVSDQKTRSKRKSPDVEKKKIVGKAQKSKQDSQQVKPVKNKSPSPSPNPNSVSKESKPQPLEGNQKVKDSNAKAQEPERTHQKIVHVARKKVDSIAVARTELTRIKDEALRRRNRTLDSLSTTPAKHKLSVLKETNRNEMRVRSEPKEVNIRKTNSISSEKKTESITRSSDNVPVCENETKRDPQINPEIIVAAAPLPLRSSLADPPSPTHLFPIKDARNNIRKADSISIANKTESATRSYDIVPACENETKRDPQIASEIVVVGTNVGIPYKSSVSENKPKKSFYSSICENETKRDPQITSKIVIPGIQDKSNLSENKPKKAFYSSIQVVLTEQEKQLKEILIKDQLFLSTAQALFKLNIPVGFLHIDDHNHHDNETKLKLDCGYEILKRKARSQEVSVYPYIRPSIGDTSIRFLDELVKQLYKDLEGVRLYGRDMLNEYDEGDYLHHMLEKDIHNKNPDINSFWDFGWHITTFTFVEKDEFVTDMEQDTLCRLVDEFIDDLLSV